MVLTAKIVKLSDGYYVFVFSELEHGGRMIPEIEMGPYAEKETAEAVAAVLTAQ